MTDEARVFGVAHTAYTLADFMAKSAISLLFAQGVPLSRIRALDPFTGDGVFLRALLDNGVVAPCAYEIRREVCCKTSNLYSGRADLHCVDAFAMKPRNFNLIIGNPPYGHCTPNAAIDARIAATYGKTTAKNKAALYDGYVRAIRWASDNLAHGVIAYIINNSFLDCTAFDAMRLCLEREFTRIHVVNLRGNHRTSGELCRKEGGNVFAQEARVGIALLFLCRNA